MAFASLEDELAALGDDDDGPINLPSFSSTPSKPPAKPISATPAAKKPATVTAPAPKATSAKAPLSALKAAPVATPAKPPVSAISKLTPGLRTPAAAPKPAATRATPAAAAPKSALARPTPNRAKAEAKEEVVANAEDEGDVQEEEAPQSVTEIKRAAPKTPAYKPVGMKYNALPLGLTGKQKKSLEQLYNTVQSGGIDSQGWVSVISELGLVGEKITVADLQGWFYRVSCAAARIQFEGFLQCVALLSLHEFAEDTEDPTLAITFLLSRIMEDGSEKGPNVSLEAAQNIAANRASNYEAQLAKRAAEDQAGVESEDPEERRIAEEKAAEQAYLRAKARVLAKREQDEAAALQQAEEAELAVEQAEQQELRKAQLQQQWKLKALERSREKQAQLQAEEQAAREEEERLLAEKDAKNAALTAEGLAKAKERVRLAKLAREQQAASQENDEAALEKAEQELKRQEEKEAKAQAGQLAAVKRAAEAAEAKVRAQQEAKERAEREQAERAARSAEAGEKGAAEAAERVESNKVPQLMIDEDAVATLQKPFDKWAVKGKLHKANFVEFITKTAPILDRHLLSLRDLDVIFSSASTKGVKGMEFPNFYKAMSMVALKRFPEKGNPDPTDALERLLAATFRKNDPELIAQKKAELAAIKREYDQAQMRIAQGEALVEERKRRAELQKQAEEKAAKEERLREQAENIKEARATAERNRIAKERREAEEREQAKIAEEERKAQMIEDMAERNARIAELQKTAQERAKQRLREKTQRDKEEAEIAAKEKAERDAKNEAARIAGAKKTSERLAEHNKNEVLLSSHDSAKLKVLFEHYKLNPKGMTRSDWLNVCGSLSLLNEEDPNFKKSEFEQIYERVWRSGPGIEFPAFAKALSLVAQRMNGEEDATTSLKMLMGDILRDEPHEEAEVEVEPTAEETAAELEARKREEALRAQRRREAREKREAEALARVQAEEAAEAEKREQAKVDQVAKLAEARKKAASRLAAAKKDNAFVVEPEARENLEVLYSHYAINVKLGMKRNDWLNLVTTLGIEDDTTIFRNDSEAIFDEVRANKALGCTLEEFIRAFAMMGERRYPPADGKSTEASLSAALALLLKSVME